MPGAIGSLDLTPTATFEESIRQLEAQFEAARQQVWQTFGSEQLAPPPGGFPLYIPVTFENVSDRDLGELLNKISNGLAFAEARLSDASVGKNYADVIREKTRAYVRVMVRKAAIDRKEKLHAQDKDDEVVIHELMHRADARCIYWETYYGSVKWIRDALQKNWETVSRQITLRGQETNRFNREATVSNIPLGRSQAFMPHIGGRRA